MRQSLADCRRDALVETFPAFPPPGESALTKTENQFARFAIPIYTPRLRSDDCAGRFRERDNVASAVLGSFGRQHDHVVVNFIPAQRRNFVCSRASQRKQFYDRAKVVVRQSVPDRADLGRGQHPIARLLWRSACSRYWVELGHAFL